MSFDSVTLPLHLTQSQLFLAPTVPLYTVLDLDKERPLAIPLVRPLPFPTFTTGGRWKCVYQFQ